MAEHTPGPLTVRWGTNVFGLRRDTGYPSSVANCGGYKGGKVDTDPESSANARRVVALWAALDGVPTEAVESGCVARLVTAARLASRLLAERLWGGYSCPSDALVPEKHAAAALGELVAALAAFPPAPESEPT